MEETTLSGQASDAQIAAWKEKYGDRIYQFTKDGHVAYMRKPDRAIMGFLATQPRDQFSETLIGNCWLGGSEYLKTNEDAYLWLCGELTQLLNWGEGELKKI